MSDFDPNNSFQDRSGWLFLIIEGKLYLKIDDKWADDELDAFSRTPAGILEIDRQWDEYKRRGCPLMSYQRLTNESEKTA